MTENLKFVFSPVMFLQAAFWGLVVGHSCGIIRMIMDFTMPSPQCGEPEQRPEILYRVHYTYFSVISFVVTTLTLLSISYATKPPLDPEVCKPKV